MSVAPRVQAGTAQRLAAAARVVSAVVHQRRSLDALMREEANRGAAADRSVIQALVYGTLRWWPQLDRYLAALVDKPGALAPAVHALLGVGLHQLEHSSHPHYAVVDETVQAARVLQAARAAGLVNAVLRRFLRERVALKKGLEQDPVVTSAAPAWLVQRVRTDWPQQWQQILQGSNEPAPMWLRVNARRIGTEDYLRALQAAGFDASRSEHAPEALRLAAPVDVEQLPGFAAGDVSVQDAAAQLTARFLEAKTGARVLDACAAPGGKACHLLELAELDLVALDLSEQRLAQVRQNLQRLQLAATVVAGDATQPQSWWDGRPFDRILIDAPCTATGVIRRHPDIKLLRRPTDVGPLAEQQFKLLASLWPLLAPGGRLLYATCSILRQENEEVLQRFLAATPQAGSVLLHAGALGRPAGEGLQILPGEAGMDGFHYACLERRPV